MCIIPYTHTNTHTHIICIEEFDVSIPHIPYTRSFTITRQEIDGLHDRHLQLVSCLHFFPFFLSFLLSCFLFLGPHAQHIEVPRLGVELELPLLAYATTTATQDPSHVCDLHHSSREHWIPDPLSEARDRTCILMGTRSDSFLLRHNRNSLSTFLETGDRWAL